MKNLITGGAGFIGSHLAEKLLNAGHHVVVIDDLSTGSKQNIASFQDHPRFRFVRDSVRNSEILEPLIEQCDVIYHLAAAVGVRLIVEQPVHTIETNIHGSEVVLEFANKFHKKVLLASSSEVYGKSPNSPFKEDDDSVLGSTTVPRWAYACSKAVEEYLGLAYHQQFQLPVIIARFFNTIGPRQTGQYGMVVPSFVERALKNEPLLIYGSGKQTRCFAHVGDVIDAVVALMDCPQALGRVFNIGSTEEISIETLADKIIQQTLSSSQKQFRSYQEAYGKSFDDMIRRVPSIDRLKQTLGFSPQTPLDQTLQIIIEEFKKRISC